MSGDIPVYVVIASCRHDEVAPLLAALEEHSLSTVCDNHEAGLCVPLGGRWSDREAYAHEVHALYEELRHAAPHAGFAAVGGASEDGPGILRFNHPELGDYPHRVPSQDDFPAPLFSAAQVRSIVADVAQKPDTDGLLRLALGDPWSEQFQPAPSPYNCQTVATADQLEADAAAIYADIAHGRLMVHQLLRDPRGTLWATATYRTGGSIILKHEGAQRRVVQRCPDRDRAARLLKDRLRWGAR